jgi:Prp8 binding protein
VSTMGRAHVRAWQIVTASADKTLGIWDAHQGKRLKKCTGHTGVVNSVSTASAKGPYIFASGSDDGTLRLYDYRVRGSFQDIEHGFPILAVAFSDDAGKLFAAGIDNNILVSSNHLFCVRSRVL